MAIAATNSYDPFIWTRQGISNGRAICNLLSIRIPSKPVIIPVVFLLRQTTNRRCIILADKFDVTMQPSRRAKPPGTYYCDYKDCTNPATGRRRSFDLKADHKRHMQTVHGNPIFDCPRPHCWRKKGNGFRCKDHIDEHLQDHHNKELTISVAAPYDTLKTLSPYDVRKHNSL